MYKYKKDKKIAGVCAGIADEYKIDVWIIRIIFILSNFLFGGGTFIYIILALMLKDKDVEIQNQEKAT